MKKKNPKPERESGSMVFRDDQTWWLTFSEGEQVLGVTIVDVGPSDAATMASYIDERRRAHGVMTEAKSDDYYLAAAARKALSVGANPGGELVGQRIDTAPMFFVMGPKCPRDRLLSQAELVELVEIA